MCAEMRAAWKEDTRQHNGSWEAARLPANDLATCCGTAAALPRCLPLPLPSRALSWFLSGLFMRGSPMPAMQLVAGKPVGGRARASAMFRVVHHLSNLQTEKYSGRGHRRLRARNVSFSLSSWFHVPFLVFILDSFMRLFRLIYFFLEGVPFGKVDISLLPETFVCRWLRSVVEGCAHLELVLSPTFASDCSV